MLYKITNSNIYKSHEHKQHEQRTLEFVKTWKWQHVENREIYKIVTTRKWHSREHVKFSQKFKNRTCRNLDNGKLSKSQNLEQVRIQKTFDPTTQPQVVSSFCLTVLANYDSCDQPVAPPRGLGPADEGVAISALVIVSAAKKRMKSGRCQDAAQMHSRILFSSIKWWQNALFPRPQYKSFSCWEH